MLRFKCLWIETRGKQSSKWRKNQLPLLAPTPMGRENIIRLSRNSTLGFRGPDQPWCQESSLSLLSHWRVIQLGPKWELCWRKVWGKRAAYLLLEHLKSVACWYFLLEAGAKISDVVQGHFSLREVMKELWEIVSLSKAFDNIQHPSLRCGGQWMNG